jgi:hypothetical protein
VGKLFPITAPAIHSQLGAFLRPVELVWSSDLRFDVQLTAP